MQEALFEEGLALILQTEGRYHRDAYLFIRDALDHTHKLLAREDKESPRRHRDSKHVTPKELLRGARELALETYGPMALTVLEEWGVRSTGDFGQLVFILVEHGLFARTDADTLADFENGYDFPATFREPYLPRAAQVKPALEPKISPA